MNDQFQHALSKSVKLIGLLSAISAFSLMGSFGVFVRNISVDESVIACSRFGVGFLFMGLSLILRRQWRPLKAHISWPLLMSGIFLALCILFYSNAIAATTLANAAFLLYLAPLIASILAHFLLREQLKVFNASLILLAFVGSSFLLSFDYRSGVTGSDGQLLALASALCYALFIIANRMISSAVSTDSRAFYQLLFGALVLLPFASKIELPFRPHDLYWLLAVGFFQGYLAISLMIISLRYLRAHEYGTISYIEPIVAALVGFLIYSESLSLLQVLGCSLILVSGFTQIGHSVTKAKQGD
jgi:drug/metabolite transporter (DMT)-like permease